MALIYIVEDDPSIREIETIALKNGNYLVHSFGCAADFYQEMKEILPDLILLDIMLPDENGYEIIDFEPGSPSSEELFRELHLKGNVVSQDAFLYTNHDVKLLFIKDCLDAEEKRLAAAHELGHIVCGHAQTNPSVKEEYDANEFVHYFLNPPFGLRFRNRIMRHRLKTAAIVLTVLAVVIGGMIAYRSVIDQKYTNYYVTSSGKKYHLRDCIQINKKTNVHRLTSEELAAGNYEPCGTCLRDLEGDSD